MRILIISDAWKPQVNGVVRTLETTRHWARQLGHECEVIGPDERFWTLPLPTYSEIKLALNAPMVLPRLIRAFKPDAIHIPTEGPLGWAARNHCVRRKIPFTTSWHTQFPEYVKVRTGIPISWTYGLMRKFHNAGQTMMVATDTMEQRCRGFGIRSISRWNRGVDTELFRPTERTVLSDLPRPISMYVGRLAVEKSLDEFLALDLPGTKVVVGDGPQMADLRRRFPDVVYTGVQMGEDLVAHYNAADAFVFPSRTDTFGLVLLEALACGVPVAAYPVQGPQDVVGGSDVGVLDTDLKAAIEAAFQVPRERCREYALRFSWERATRDFIGNLRPGDPEVIAAA